MMVPLPFGWIQKTENNMQFKKALTLTLLSLILSPFVKGQEYFQQSVDYKIDVRLDDTLHRLKANMTLTYTNASNDSLEYLMFHLWPNGYKNNRTALAQQFRKGGATNFQFADKKDKGYIDGLDFKWNGQKLIWHYYKYWEDVAVVHLPRAMQPGETIQITTPFEVKLPGDFSRIGHVGQSYQITQWYPKPAVYDKDGWHPMPYLNLGEFYSEYGSFEVKITVPENYRVAATGVLQEDSERNWLLALNDSSHEYIDKKRPHAKSSDRYKTITYKQDNVHDFGWFANKDWYVRKSQVTTPAGKEVDTWAFFTPEKSKNWKRATQYLDSSIYYYSKWVGEYQYSAATAVNGALSAGGGMEYPMVTVISAGGSPKLLDNVIMHEIGHNWFYGMLGSNERTHAWMDEGFNSYIEDRYMKKFYPGHSFADEAGGLGDFIKKKKYPTDYSDWLIAHFLGSFNQQAPIDSRSHEFSDLSYGLLSYKRPAFLFKYLERYLGYEKMDKCLHAYFDKWLFKHPGPDDVKAVFEATSGKDLDWFFDDLFQTKKQMDYKLSSVKYKGDELHVKVRNTGKINGAYVLDFYSGDSLIQSTWVDGHAGSNLQSYKLAGITSVQIDAMYFTPDLIRENNRMRTNGLFKKIEPIKLDLLTFFPDQKHTRVHVLPVLGSNATDKFMLGLSFHNQDIGGKRFNYRITPMYSFGDKSLVGSAHFYRDFQLLNRRWNKLRLRATAKRYAGFSVIQPSLSLFTIDRRYRRSTYLAETKFSFNYVETKGYEGLYPSSYQFLRIDHQVSIKSATLDREIQVRANYFMEGSQQGSVDAKVEINWRPLKWLELRANAFAGTFMSMGETEMPQAYQSFYGTSSFDYGMNYFMFDRMRNGGYGWLGTNQILNDQGNLKSEALSGNNLATAGLAIKFKKIPLVPYANIGTNGDIQVYEAGAGLELGVLTVYLPFAGTQFSNQDIAGFKQYSTWMRYSLKFNLVDIIWSLEKKIN